MLQHAKILEKIEKLVDQLPYKSVKIEIEIGCDVLILDKTKSNQIGFIQN